MTSKINTDEVKKNQRLDKSNFPIHLDLPFLVGFAR